MTQIIDDTKDNLHVDDYEIEALQTFLDEINNHHLKELEDFLTKAKQHFRNDLENHDHVDLIKLKIRIGNNLNKIWAKMMAINSELEKHPQLLTKTGLAVYESAVDKYRGIRSAFLTDRVTDEEKFQKLNDAILFIPHLRGEIVKLNFVLPANETPTDESSPSVDIAPPVDASDQADQA